MEESTSREKILKKVRNALMNKPTKESIANIDFESEVFYKANDEPELIFAQNFTEAGGKFIFCEDKAVLIDNLDFVVKESGWTLVIIMVYNMLGQCLKTSKTNETQTLLDGIQWYKGVYMITIKSEHSSTFKKVIIN